MTEEKQTKTPFQRWYDKPENRERLAKVRKRKYDKDPEYREKRKAEAKRYYWLKKRRAERIAERTYSREEFPPDRWVDIEICNPDDIRYGETVTVPVFYPRSLAKVLNRTTQTLRLWSLEGNLPDPAHRDAGNNRIYTADEFRVVVENAHLLKLPAKDFSQNPFFRVIREEWSRMPDGIEPMLKGDWRKDIAPCRWCGSSESLQHRTHGNTWIDMPCFECVPPGEDRWETSQKTVVLSGHCPQCDLDVEEEQIDTGHNVLQCPRCERRI